MSTADMFSAMATYMGEFADTFYVVFAWLLAIAAVDVVVMAVRGARR